MTGQRVRCSPLARRFRSMARWLCCVWFSSLLVEAVEVCRKRSRHLQPLHDGFEFDFQERRLGHLGGQFVGALLQRRHLVGILRSEVVLLGRILRDVEEFDRRREQGSPDQFPIALADASAKGLHVVDNLRAR
jgi:hypothetical protein